MNLPMFKQWFVDVFESEKKRDPYGGVFGVWLSLRLLLAHSWPTTGSLFGTLTSSTLCLEGCT